VAGEHVQQGGQPGRVVADAAAGQQLPAPVDQGDVVVVFGPVDAAKHFHEALPSFAGYDTCSHVARPRGSRTLPNGRAPRRRHPISRW
jgi:hypothetical protein